MNKYYITTAIDYVNSSPHLGHVYEKITADAIARYYRLKGYDTYFLIGTDEHGSKIEKAAQANNISPLDWCNNIANEFINTWKTFNISNDDFIRTTESRHIEAVKKIFLQLYNNGDIYKDKYEGWYCSGCEGFLLERDLIDNKCPIHQKTPEWVVEENYFLNIEKYKSKIKEHILNNPEFIQPEGRRQEVLNILDDFKNVSVSRQSVSWGIPVPIEPSHTIYVWVDALSNYITALGFLGEDDSKFKKYWPANLQLIGKDILRFHAIIWPTILLALNLPLPKTIFVHGFIYINSEKMSKSLGNVISPNDLLSKYPVDAIRYYLLREISFGLDGDFNIESFENRVDADLANNLGNSLNRILNILEKNLNGIIPEAYGDKNIIELFNSMLNKVDVSMSKLALEEALVNIWQFIDSINKYIDEKKPWTIAKQLREDPENKELYKELAEVLYTSLESLRLVAIISSSFIPNISLAILEQLGFDEPLKQIKWDNLKWGLLKQGTRTNFKGPVFLRVGKELADKSAKKKKI